MINYIVLKIWIHRKICLKQNWRTKRFEGKGKYEFSTGTRYDGELKDGMFHGKGTLFFENGAKYEANWSEGVATDVIEKNNLNLAKDYLLSMTILN